MSPFTQRLTKLSQLAIDALAVGIATYPLAAVSDTAFWLLAACWVIGIYRLTVSLSHYSTRRPFWDELRELISTIIIMATLHTALVLSTHTYVSTPALLTSWCAALFALPLARNMMRNLLRKLNLWYQPLIIVGTGNNSLEAKRAIQSERTLGYRYVASIAPDPHCAGWLNENTDAMIAIALEHDEAEIQDVVLQQLNAASRDYFIIPPMRGLPLQGLVSFHTFSHEVLLLRASNRLKQLPSRILKRLIDCSGAVILLLVLWPIMVVIYLLIRSDGSSGLFFHERVGHQGRRFLCPKFRTMVPNAEAVLAHYLNEDPQLKREWHQSQKLKNDPRVTPIGRFLRSSSLDELPQLVTVLTGRMSLVGPRPITLSEQSKYENHLTYYTQVLPGITGLWQVSGRSNTDYARRIALDVWYVKNWSLWTDMVILLKTVAVVIRRHGAR